MFKKRICGKDNLVIITIIGIIISQIYLTTSLPNGATIDIKQSSTAQSDGTTSVAAIAGNVTEININGVTVTQSWQGYFGNITGGFVLSDASGNNLYNWSSVNANGEVYASKNSTITWTNIQCFNYTADGTFNDDSSQKGANSLYGLNLTQLENNYNISFDDTDGINETFTLNNHEEFYTNNLLFSSGECKNTKLLNASGSSIFDVVLLYSPEAREVIFTSLLQDNTNGFDDALHDFEMIVLDDGHGTDTVSLDYYFYLELG